MKEVDERFLPERRIESSEIKEIVRELNEHILSPEEIKDILSEIEPVEIQEDFSKPRIVDSKSKLDSVILCNPELKLRRGFDSQYKKAVQFFVGEEDEITPTLVRDLENVLIQNLHDDVHHEQRPDILDRYVESNHIERMSIPQSKHSISCCDSARLMSVLSKSKLEIYKEEELQSIADELSHGLAMTESRIVYWDLDVEKYPLIESMLCIQRDTLERKVRKNLSLTNSHQSPHLGIVDGRIYLWNPDRTPNDMMNVWGKSFFYFEPNNLAQIILEAGTRLGFHEKGYEQLRHLNKIVEQTISNKSGDKIRSKNSKYRMLGDVLHLQCDILGVSPRTLEAQIERVAGKNGHGGITNPKLLRGTELEMLRARLGAIVNSDCWLGQDGRLYYTEADEERMRIVADLFLKLGDMSFKIESNDVNGSYRMWIPKPMGHAFIFWGFTPGDKPVQNERLSAIIRDGPLESYIAYLEDLISEDGSFDHVNGFRWSRTIVLELGTKDTNYVMESQFSDDEINFLLGFDDARRYLDEVYIPITRLERRANSCDGPESEVIKRILEIVKKNRSRLLDDEASLARKLGIEVQISSEYITLYKESGRISLKWVATTKRKDDAIKWALIASPNDPRKNGLVQDWLSLIPDDIERIRK